VAHDARPRSHNVSECQTDTGERLNDISDDYIVRLNVEGGHSPEEIAGQIGCSTSLVYAR